MNRSYLFTYIEERLTTLSTRINLRGKLNILDLNIYSENFFAELINLIFNYQLINMNAVKQNVEGIDLIDNTNKIIVQVSSTCTKQKIESSLKKDIFLKYPGYRFKFISISKDASDLRKKTFDNPHKVLFDSIDDIIDLSTILKVILGKTIAEQEVLYEFTRRELGNEVDIVKMDSNLATIINILSAENLNNIVETPQINSFQIDKKITHNSLKVVKPIIEDYRVYYFKLDEKYKEFDKLGANKSTAVLQLLRKQYFTLKQQLVDNDQIFLRIMDNVMDIIKNSKNFMEIPYEELDMCVGILVVDAFVRCKIFENPEGYNHVIA